jgi:CRP-like cAMP-binding protein
VLVHEGERDDTIFLVLDGVLDADVGGEKVAEAGPGAIVGERASLEGRRSATLRARTPCRVVALDPSALSDDERRQIAAGHRHEYDE